MEERVVLNVGGMTCNSCAQGISRHLLKKGLKDVNVDYDGGTVEYETVEGKDVSYIIDEINSLGYHASLPGHQHDHGGDHRDYHFLVALILTVPLLLHMFIPFHWLHNGYIQLTLSLPVVLIGLHKFGKSAWGSLKHLQPNMDVLIVTGSLAAFIYSVAGLIIYGAANSSDYLYFETAAAIITFLLLGNLIEHRTLKKTNSALKELSQLRPVSARKIENPLTDKESTKEIDASHLKVNDLVLINTGDKVPADGLIYWGKGTFDESSMTGESVPAVKTENDQVLAGTILLSGSVKVIAQATGDSTVLNNVIKIVKNAHAEKPSIQRMGDKVSNWFVPVVLLLALLTFIISYLVLNLELSSSLLRGIAVLVISCPCAMGLATPTAVSAGIGRAAKEGIVIRNGRVLEDFSQTTMFVFDKTGTLTLNSLVVSDPQYFTDENTVHDIIQQLEQHSGHPFAKALLQLPKPASDTVRIRFKEIEEIKGSGMKATDFNGEKYFIGRPEDHNDENPFQVIVSKSGKVLAGFRFSEEVRNGVREVIDRLRSKGIKTMLLSGDNENQCKKIAAEAGIEKVMAGQSPIDKHRIITQLQQTEKVAMVGDGINDSPSLAVAGTGISFGSAAQIAVNTADIILLNESDFRTVFHSYQIAVATMTTIKQNLFWALIYNVIAIPAAAVGLLSPVISSLSMAFSDVVVIGNSLRLKIKNIFA